MAGKKGSNLIHGHSTRKGNNIHNESPEYRTWTNMKTRCYNVNNKSYKNYGGRGITMCERWKNSFINFLEDVGEKPSLKHSLDRRDNEKGYYKDNCYWATPKQQANNTRCSKLITFQNRTQTLMQWTDELGLKYKSVFCRIKYLGWSIEDALTVKRGYGCQYHSRRQTA